MFQTDIHISLIIINYQLICPITATLGKQPINLPHITYLSPRVGNQHQVIDDYDNDIIVDEDDDGAADYDQQDDSARKLLN